jgi:hypothetical protein
MKWAQDLDILGFFSYWGTQASKQAQGKDM